MRTLVLLCVLSLVTACGADGDASTGNDARAYSEAELQEALLVLEDLPKGWKAGESVEVEGPDDEPCRGTEDEPQGEAEANFERSNFGPFFTEYLDQLDEDAARASVESLRTRITECPAYSVTVDDTITEIAQEEIDAPDLGDESVAVEVTTTTPRGTFVINLYLVRIDGTLATFVYGGFGGVNADALAKLAEQGIEKLLALD